MKQTYLLILACLTLTQGHAQMIKEKAINASIGYGLSAPYDDIAISSNGFYLQGEYVMTLASWIDIRPYAGLILTKNVENKRMPSEYKSNANAFLIGGKTRIKAPIPWVAPFFELGFGASIGAFETVTPWTDIKESGVLMHIPFSIGLELGRQHNFEVAFTYYFHDSAQQFAGAMAVGFSMPLTN